MQFIEYSEQVKIFEWAFYKQKALPPLKFLFASQAGEKFKSQTQAYRAKLAGLRAGVPDIFLPYPCGGFCGLFIELKRPYKKGASKPKISEAQLEFLDYLNKVGYLARVCYGAEEAIDLIENYIKQGL